MEKKSSYIVKKWTKIIDFYYSLDCPIISTAGKYYATHFNVNNPPNTNGIKS